MGGWVALRLMVVMGSASLDGGDGCALLDGQGLFYWVTRKKVGLSIKFCQSKEEELNIRYAS